MGAFDDLLDGLSEQTEDYHEGSYPYGPSPDGSAPRSLSWWSPIFRTYVTVVEYDSGSGGLALEVPRVALGPDEVLSATMPLPDSPYDFVCPRCGCRFETVDAQGFSTLWLDRGPIPPRYCPNCGWRRDASRPRSRE